MITVFCGPMFAGKTSSLLGEAAMYGGQPIFFKPHIDTRSSSSIIRTHDGAERLAVSVAFPDDLDAMVPPGVTHVLIDEAQFFSEALVPAVARMAHKGLRVTLAGLDLDYAGRPFGCMGALLAVADRVMKLRTDYCAKCLAPHATRTYRKTGGTETVLVGGAEAYEPRCLKCWWV
jgi:thymidine kinase